MKSQSFLRTWRIRAGLAMAVGAASCGGAGAQESPSLAAVVQAPRLCKACASSPKVAVETTRGGETFDVATRLSAVSVLAATAWQVDAEIEDALVFALRGDPSDKVRTQVAATFAASKYLTPKAHDALQLCVVGSGRDGFAGERSPAVKAQAAQALRRHPTSGNPAQIAALQRETAEAKHRRPTLAAPVGMARREGAEESSPPPSLGGPVPSDLPVAPVEKTTATPPPPTFTTVPIVVDRLPPVVSPVKATIPPPLPNSAPIAADKLPLPPAPKVVDRNLPTNVLPPQVGEDKAMTLRERRAELRELGLKDPSMKIFAEVVGAPPPTKPPAPVSAPETSGVVQVSATSATPPSSSAVQPAPRGFLGKLFGSRSPAPAPATPEPMPLSNATPLRTP